MSDEEIESWLNDDSEDRALAVNEGTLRFLDKLPDNPVHHIRNSLIIENESLTNGWIDLIQCHEHLDAVPATQIVYQYKHINNLRIESYYGIARVWIEGKSVQMENISKNARLCIRAKVRILQILKNGTYILRNGPFHRKFLDGYYPMQVTLTIRYPSEDITIQSIEPEQQPGFHINKAGNELIINALFEGMLKTEIRFKQL